MSSYEETDTHIKINYPTVELDFNGSWTSGDYNHTIDTFYDQTFETIPQKTIEWLQVHNRKTESEPPLIFKRPAGDTNVYKLIIHFSAVYINVYFQTSDGNTDKLNLPYKGFYGYENSTGNTGTNEEHPFLYVKDRQGRWKTIDPDNQNFMDKYHLFIGSKLLAPYTHWKYHFLFPVYEVIIPKEVTQVTIKNYWDQYYGGWFIDLPTIFEFQNINYNIQLTYTDTQFTHGFLGTISNGTDLYIRKELTESIHIKFSKTQNNTFSSLKYTLSFKYQIDSDSSKIETHEYTADEFTSMTELDITLTELTTTLKNKNKGVIAFSEFKIIEEDNINIHKKQTRIWRFDNLNLNLNYTVYEKINIEANTNQNYVDDILFLKLQDDNSYELSFKIIDGIMSIPDGVTFTNLININSDNTTIHSTYKIINQGTAIQTVKITGLSLDDDALYEIQLTEQRGSSVNYYSKTFIVNKQIIQSVTYSDHVINLVLESKYLTESTYQLNYNITNPYRTVQIQNTLSTSMFSSSQTTYTYTLPSTQYETYVFSGENTFIFQLKDSEEIINQQLTTVLNINDITAEINCVIQ